MSFLADFVTNLYRWIVVSSARTVPQVVNAFNVKKKITGGCCIRELQLALVLLDFLEACV